jgi:glycosyltransferase involved in cell wall biosynthesis
MTRQVVLYVMDSLGLSGRTKGILDLALRLDGARWSPVVCALSEETSPLADDLSARGVPIEVIRVAPGLRPAAILELASLMRRRRVGVVHAVNPRPLLYAGVAARALGVRATIGSLSAFACQVPDRRYDFLPQELGNRGRRSAIRNQVACALMRHVVAVSEELGDRFCRFTAEAARPFAFLGYRALKRRMKAISYGVDLARFEAVTAEQIAALRAQAGATGDAVLVGSAGRLVEQKDYPTQLRAFALAAREDARLRMVIAGDGPLRASTQALAAKLGVGDRVAFLGHWTRVPELLRALDVFVLASKFEPYGVALLEAKCAASAVVATAVNEIPHLIEDGVTGLVVPAGRPEAMAAAFLRLSSDADLRRALGRGALADARRRHSLEAVATAYQDLYHDALS